MQDDAHITHTCVGYKSLYSIVKTRAQNRSEVTHNVAMSIYHAKSDI